MPSKIITPPDHFSTEKNILIINPKEDNFVNLVLWLKTVPDEYTIHVYIDKMNRPEWASMVAESADVILVSDQPVPEQVAQVIKNKSVVKIGLENSDFADLLQYFLANRQSLV